MKWIMFNCVLIIFALSIRNPVTKRPKPRDSKRQGEKFVSRQKRNKLKGFSLLKIVIRVMKAFT